MREAAVRRVSCKRIRGSFDSLHGILESVGETLPQVTDADEDESGTVFLGYDENGLAIYFNAEGFGI